MATLIRKPSIVGAAGNKEKIIREFFGNVNSKTSEMSMALMQSPEGWAEPGQTPEFDEYTLVLKGALKAETGKEVYIISEGEAFVSEKGEWVRYSSPFKGGADYIAVCLPAFSPLTVNRDND
ncbi:MAG: hypothetical protein ABSG89_00410 [Bacteroidales bacterium]|jgi:quercetin dioxygenase-like cupin family protein